MFPILIQAGPFTLHTYGLMVAVGFLVALRVARSQFETFELPVELLDKTVLVLMIAGLLGARAAYFLIESREELVVDPLSFFRVWEGGLVFYGSVIAGLPTLYVFARRNGLAFLSLTDAFAAPLLLGHAFGRIGCFAAGCCYGKPTGLPWGVSYSNPASLAPLSVTLHPTQLYESAGNALLFLATLAVSRRRPRAGVTTAFYCASYGLFRFFIETLRGDERGTFHYGASPSQLIALALVALGGALYLYGKKQEGV